jgi:ketosteroid isomerase-like protein
VSAENVEIVRAIYRAWEEGSPRDSGLLADDIEWVNDKQAVEPGTRKGAEAFDDAAEKVTSTFEGARVEFERFIDAGIDQVLVIGMLRGVGQGSGVDVGRRQGYLWTIRDGKAVRFQWFNNPAEAFEAAGLEDQP